MTPGFSLFQHTNCNLIDIRKLQKKILAAHQRWLDGDTAGSCAILGNANLSGTILRGADLRGTILHGAILHGADFRGANLTNVLGLSIADDAPQRLQAVVRAALASDDALEMDRWHTCDQMRLTKGLAIVNKTC